MLLQVPTAFGNCAFFGNCSAGGYGGCHNETTVPCLPADGCTSGYNGLPALTFTGGKGTATSALSEDHHFSRARVFQPHDPPPPLRRQPPPCAPCAVLDFVSMLIGC